MKMALKWGLEGEGGDMGGDRPPHRALKSTVQGRGSLLHVKSECGCYMIVVGGDEVRFAFSKDLSGCFVEGRLKGGLRTLGLRDPEIIWMIRDGGPIRGRAQRRGQRLGFGINLCTCSLTFSTSVFSTEKREQ